MASRSWWPCWSSATVTDVSRAIRHPSHVANAAAPPDDGGAGEVTGVRESRHHHHIALLQLAVGDRAVEVDRDARGEQVAALVKRVAVTPSAFPVLPASCAGRRGWAGW